MGPPRRTVTAHKVKQGAGSLKQHVTQKLSTSAQACNGLSRLCVCRKKQYTPPRTTVALPKLGKAAVTQAEKSWKTVDSTNSQGDVMDEEASYDSQGEARSPRSPKSPLQKEKTPAGGAMKQQDSEEDDDDDDEGGGGGCLAQCKSSSKRLSEQLGLWTKKKHPPRTTVALGKFGQGAMQQVDSEEDDEDDDKGGGGCCAAFALSKSSSKQAEELETATLKEALAEAKSLMVLRIVSTEMNRNFRTFGKMDAFFAVVKWIAADGATYELSRTKTDWRGNTQPVWNHTCRAQPFPSDCNDEVEIQVMEHNPAWHNSFCGSAKVALRDLLDESSVRSSLSHSAVSGEASALSGPDHPLELRIGDDITGSVVVQAMVIGPSGVNSVAKGDSDLVFTAVDPAMFESPVKALGVSGGTAAFFQLRRVQGMPPAERGGIVRSPLCKSEADQKSPGFYLGKDLGRAEAEVTFYEEVLKICAEQGRGGMGPIIDFMFEYLGVLTASVEPSEGGHDHSHHHHGSQGEEDDAQQKKLLVMRNLRDGCKSFRMLDVKIGQKTASKNWRGKSRLRALKQDVVDGHTNSQSEGFRLEGFDDPPQTLGSIDPLLDFGRLVPLANLASGAQDKIRKKAMRLMMQRMHAGEFFMHFLDVHHTPLEQSNLEKFFSATEVTEVVFHEMVIRLTALALACRTVPVPQKWVGSSVALGFDSAKEVPRVEERECRRRVCVKIFDWGRSELNTAERHALLDASQQSDREEYWQYYCGGIDRLAWEAALTYWHRFSNSQGWDELSIAIYDFDAASKSDFMGMVTITLEDTNGTREVELNFPDEQKSFTADKIRSIRSTLNRKSLTAPMTPRIKYSVEFQSLPEGGRLSGLWRVKLIGASDLPACDSGGSSDPFAIISASSRDGQHILQYQTSVIQKSLCPFWRETFDLPVAAASEQLRLGLDAVAPLLGNITTSSNFGGCSNEEGHEGSLIAPTPRRMSALTVVQSQSSKTSDDSHANKSSFESWVHHLDSASKSVAHPTPPEEIYSRLLSDDLNGRSLIAATKADSWNMVEPEPVHKEMALSPIHQFHSMALPVEMVGQDNRSGFAEPLDKAPLPLESCMKGSRGREIGLPVTDSNMKHVMVTRGASIDKSWGCCSCRR